MKLQALILAAAALAAGSAGVAFAADDSNTSKASVDALVAAAERPTLAVNSVQADAAQAFKLLRTAPASPLPDDVAELVGSPQRYGRNPTLARAIKTASGSTGYVIPGDGYLCIAVPDGSYGWASSCLPTKVAAQRGLSVGLMSADGRTADTLLVPDGASAARVNGPVSTTAPVATAATKKTRVRVNSVGVATARTNAPGSLRVSR